MASTVTRTQCQACPWRDMATMPDYAVAYAREGHLDGFVCHTRCGPCPGPRLAIEAERRAAIVAAAAELEAETGLSVDGDPL